MLEQKYLDFVNQWNTGHPSEMDEPEKLQWAVVAGLALVAQSIDGLTAAIRKATTKPDPYAPPEQYRTFTPSPEAGV